MRDPVYSRDKMSELPVEWENVHAWKRASLLVVVCYKFRRSCTEIIDLRAHLFFYLQVEWSTNSLFGRGQIPKQTYSIVVLFDVCHP